MSNVGRLIVASTTRNVTTFLNKSVVKINQMQYYTYSIFPAARSTVNLIINFIIVL